MSTPCELQSLADRLEVKASRAFNLGDERQAERLWVRISELRTQANIQPERKRAEALGV